MTRPEPVTPVSQRARDDLMPRGLQGSVPLTASVTQVVVPGALCPAGPGTPDPPVPPARESPGRVTGLPSPEDVCRVTSILRDHPRWSAFWDKRYRVWRVAEDDPDSGLYAESSDAGTVIGYIQAYP